MAARSCNDPRAAATGHWWKSVFENRESEFLHMAAFILLTTVLVQRGSPESRRRGVKELSPGAKLGSGRENQRFAKLGPGRGTWRVTSAKATVVTIMAPAITPKYDVLPPRSIAHAPA